MALETQVPNRRGNNFDALRLALSLNVVLFHMVVLSEMPALAPFGPMLHAEMLIPFFISISGFLIVMSFERSHGVWDYFERRFRRILPAYYAAIVLCVVVGMWLTALPIGQYLRSSQLYRYVGWNSAFLNYREPYLPGVFTHQPSMALNGAIWTVKVELTIYALVPLLVVACRRYGWYLVLGISYLLSVAYVVVLHHWPAPPGGPQADLLSRLTRQFPGQIAYFASGALLYRFWANGGRLPWWSAAAGLVGCMVLTGDAYTVALPACAAVMAIYLAQYAPYVGHWARYGDFSYGLFVCHYPLVQAAVALGVFTLSPFIAVPGTMAVVLIVAVLSWRFIERPSLPQARVRRTEGPPAVGAVFLRNAGDTNQPPLEADAERSSELTAP